jgi:catechol 2,3-dioxygenase-like lactoylglutathione lyase family enzyme
MFDHIGIVVTDLRRGASFYARILEPLGLRITEKHPRSGGEGRVVLSTGAPYSPFFVVAAGRPSFWTDDKASAQSPIHLCFSAPSREAVDRFHAVGLSLGARDNGRPGARGERSYSAFLIDFDGNNVEARVWEPPHDR